ncbi:NAD(P)H-dependent glycerol-3-phosphate dehydrogenase [Aerococcus sp. UMB7834]|uniref:NAD(P)H-dependent glycerol-3-phosphate dehydrogenase n=1 Tax=Aerococcus sp. UMB7834 TaxID=3046342 RepID=UPI00254B38B6|nr:NAD(P)H-dependent glycerol-3-phosphate dehydrogenase [Aerococcus sp. UMB7834]MDK6804926.1 NAD(P)H-dependent glycerol-3-phosphate dehydrogenase [Aerococcus sp. UMB7834]
MQSYRVAVLGAGSWGSALAMVLNDNQHQVRLWTIDAKQAEEIRQTRINAAYLPDLHLAEDILVTTDLSEALKQADMVCFVVPTKAIRSVSQQVKEVLASDQTSEADKPPLILHASKGLEQGSHLRISQIIEEVLEDCDYRGIVALSGPSHAEEVAVRHITTITAASQDLEAAKEVQAVFLNRYFRVYTNTDCIGVELGGALKNIIAVAAGGVDGLNYGDNTKAALITRGLAEITRLGLAMGADPLTFSGLSGVGDLIVTCNSVHSRNWRAGNKIAQGASPEEVEAKMGMVVEGIPTTKAAYELAADLGVDMPITNALYAILYEGMPVEEALTQLMMREGKEEAQLRSALIDYLAKRT